jgi:hypothetical protein
MPNIASATSAFNRHIVGALTAATIIFSATAAAAAGQTPVGISEPGHLPQARALLRSDSAARPSLEIRTLPAAPADERPKAAWEECEPGSYWMMIGPDRSIPMLCR